MGQPHSIAWSPDGSRLAFVLGNAAFVYAPYAIGNIAPSSISIVSASGGRPERVTDATSLNTSPAWMPDGRSLLFVSDRDGSRDLYRVGMGRTGRPTGAPVRLTTGLQCTPSISRTTAECWSTPTSPTTPTSGRCRSPRRASVRGGGRAPHVGPPVDRGHGDLA